MRVWAVAAAGLLVAGSGVASGGEVHDILSSKSQAERRALLAAVVSSAGNACGSASRDFYLGDAENAGFWTVRCSSGDYIVKIENSGQMNSRVLSCAVANALGVECWRPF